MKGSEIIGFLILTAMLIYKIIKGIISIINQIIATIFQIIINIIIFFAKLFGG